MDQEKPSRGPDAGYAEALRCIQNALKSGDARLDLCDIDLTALPPEIGQLAALTTLDVFNNQLTALPPEIGRLTALTTLNVSFNQLTALPPEIGQLTALTDLYVSHNQLTALPPELGQLTALTKLWVDRNQLTALPPKTGRLAALTALRVDSNRLTALPPAIGQLTALTELYLFNNQLTALPPEIGQLTALMALDASRNQLTGLPREIGQLKALIGLHVSDNKLAGLPGEIGELTALTTLSLDDNKLSALPPEIGQLTALTGLFVSNNQLKALPEGLRALASLQGLFLHGNDDLGLPPEVLGATLLECQGYTVGGAKDAARPEDILSYYFRTYRGLRRALNEVKVILVGQGSVGKTSLVKRIVYNTFSKREKKTDGIYINKDWSVPGKKGGRVQVNFWDFGGQEIMHATHQFFLTKRTVYVLVLDARKGENESNVHYWLKIIRSYGGDSPVLVVTNKCETHHLDLNETRLKKDYPSIRGFFKTSCEEGRGIEQLKRAIAKQIRSAGMRHVFDPLPAAYFGIKQELEQLARRQNYLDIREYYVLCQKKGVAEREQQDQLLRFLHDLGSVLSFNDPDSPYALREMSVLNPEWVTEGVYKILNDKELPKCAGVLKKSDLVRILTARKHPAKCHPYITDMMGKFELSFAIEGRERWLVAELLPKNEPPIKWDAADALNFQYQYDVLPAAIICRFIVRRYRNLGAKPVYWRSGVVLEFDGCRALVRSDTDKGRMHISVRGLENGRRGVLAVIRDEFAEIHATVPGLLPQELVPLPDNPEVTVPYAYLLTLEKERVAEFIPVGASKLCSVRELLDGIEAPWGREGPYLYPPFFGIEPQNSFADAWEVFCCEILNRHEKTTRIYQRKPPEGGIDLYWKQKQIAYQCKSVEDRTGKFNLSKAIDSLKSALDTRKHLPWKKYVLCVNVALTGEQERKLRAELPDIELLTPSFWIPRTHEQWRHVQRRFRNSAGRPGADRREV